MINTRLIGRAALAGISCAAATVAMGAGPAAAQSSTTVSPAGADVTATSQGKITMSAGSMTVSCDSSTTGTVPAAPDNTNPSGPVNVPIAPPTFTNCTTDTWGVSATITTNNDNGEWSIEGQNGSPITGSLAIPQAGMVVETSGLASCTAVVAPDSAGTINGSWTNGDPSTVAIDDDTPISVTGGWACPTSATTGHATATYDVENASDPSTPITVGP